LDAITAAIINFLPRADTTHQKRWAGIKGAVDRAHTLNVDRGISGDSVRIGIDDLQAVDVDAMEVDHGASEAGEGDDDHEEDGKDSESKVMSPVRRSSRLPKVAEKVRLATGGDMDEGDEGDNDNDDKLDDEEVGGSRTDRGKGVDSAERPREKKKPYNASVHFYWDQAVRCANLGALLPINVRFSVGIAWTATGFALATSIWRVDSCLRRRSVKAAQSFVSRV
jgi:hypothetical protein